MRYIRGSLRRTMRRKIARSMTTCQALARINSIGSLWSQTGACSRPAGQPDWKTPRLGIRVLEGVGRIQWDVLCATEPHRLAHVRPRGRWLDDPKVADQIVTVSAKSAHGVVIHATEELCCAAPDIISPTTSLQRETLLQPRPQPYSTARFSLWQNEGAWQ